VSVPHSSPILLCYDGSAGARRAITVAGALFPGRTAIVLHSWRPVAGIAAAYAIVPTPACDPKDLRRAALHLAEEGVELARAAGLQPSPQIVEAAMDAVWHAILRAADEEDVAVIVLGARGLSPLRSAVMGSISHAVSQHAHRPVLIVPPAAESEAAPADAALAAEAHSETLAVS
jgi:nucleotide-binding universal stress UspA family protein